MDKDFIKKAIIFPAVVGLIGSIAFFAYAVLHMEQFEPFYRDTVIAYFDTAAQTEALTDKTDWDTLEVNDCVGLMHAASNIPVLYDGEYTNLDGALSYISSVSVPDGGYAYLYSLRSDTLAAFKKDTVTFESITATKTYRFHNEKTFNSEQEALAYAPEVADALIIYARAGDAYGLTPQYKAVVLEEVTA